MDCWKLVVGFSKPQLTIIWGGRDVRKLQSSTRDGRGWTLATSQLSCIRNDAFQEGHYSRYKMVAFVVPLVSFMDRVQHVADCPPNLHWALKVKVRRCVLCSDCIAHKTATIFRLSAQKRKTVKLKARIYTIKMCSVLPVKRAKKAPI